MASDKVIQATDGNFQDAVLDASVPTIVDFWAVWCGPCRQIAPLLDELADEYDGKVQVAKVNVDENPVTATNYGIRSIPSLLVFKGGKLVDTHVGAAPKGRLKALFDSVL